MAGSEFVFGFVYLSSLPVDYESDNPRRLGQINLEKV